MKKFFRVMTAICMLLLFLVAGANDGGVVPFHSIVLWGVLTMAAGIVSAYFGGLFEEAE